jgi:YidC/Oxa1 family membrane protein insertase
MKHNHHHPEDHRRMVIFFVLAALIMGLSYFFITKPQIEKAREQQGVVADAGKKAPVAVVEEQAKLKGVAESLKGSSRIQMETPTLTGSFATKGLRFDDVELTQYFTTLEDKKPVRLLAPNDTKKSQFVEIGLMGDDENTIMPTNATQWKIVSGGKLTKDNPISLEWDNGKGLTFRRMISIDDKYLITVVQNITNNTKADVVVYPYALVSQAHHIPEKGEKITFEDQPSSVQHIGPIGYMGDDLHEESYKDVKEDKKLEYKNSKGWLGITSKYWLVALLPLNQDSFDARITHQTGSVGQDIYQTDLREQPITVAAGQTGKSEIRFFAGAKKLDILNDYEKSLEVPQFVLAVDFGILYLLTKPLYHLLSYLGNFFHSEFNTPFSFGIALLVITVLLRGVTFPLQNKSYRSMNRMKDLGPKMNALKEKYADDKAKFQQEVMALYKREKINPASGCLPILIQIPIFFALYKVIYITLDMRHAPFWGWINDLAAPDPTNVFNLFGLLPFTTPEFLVIGAWPLLYGITMFIQQRLNPQPEDPIQKQVFAMMPWMFMFIFAKFPAGLVIYYTWSNLLGIVQQYMLRKLHGTEPVKKKKKKHD